MEWWAAFCYVNDGFASWIRGDPGMIFNDLREFIAEVEKRDDVKVVEGADWHLEIGLITEWQISEPNNPLLLFKNIKGYPPEYSVATNLFGTPARTALALGLSPDLKKLDIVRSLCGILGKGFTPIPPVEVDDAPVKQNVLIGDEVDLFKFPVPCRACPGTYTLWQQIYRVPEPDSSQDLSTPHQGPA